MEVSYLVLFDVGGGVEVRWWRERRGWRDLTCFFFKYGGGTEVRWWRGRRRGWRDLTWYFLM